MRARLARTGSFAAPVAILALLTAGAAASHSQRDSWRTGNPPVLSSASIDSQRRLTVTWSAPDGMTFGGWLLLDNDSRNATPISSNPRFGPLMFCNNTNICRGRWRLANDPGTGPFTYTTEALSASRFPAGTYYVQVEGYNEDPFPSTRYWEWSNIVVVTVPAVDTTPPETTLAGGPTDATNSATASFTFTSSETPSTFECRLDNAAFTACTSPREYTGLAPGSHTFEVRARDAAGNTDPTPASRTWTIDATAPETSITAGPTGTVAATAATFVFAASESSSTFECRLDGAAFAPCTSPASYDKLATGKHTFDVRAIDPAGNVDASPATRSWTIRAVPSASGPAAQPGKAQPKRAQKRAALKVRRPEDNETPACGKALNHIDRLERELAKAVGNWNFENRLTGNERAQETRLEQLDRRIERLETELVAALNDANRACGADWGGVWRGKGTVVTSKCDTPSPVKVTLKIAHDAAKRTIDTVLSYELDARCPADAYPALLRRGGVDIDLGVSRVTGRRIDDEAGGHTLEKTGADTLRGKFVRTVSGIRLTLEFTAKRV